MANRLRIAIAAVLLLVSALAAAQGGTVSFDLGEVAPAIESAESAACAGKGRRVVQRVSAPGYGSCISSGDPALPCKTLYLALPPDADEGSVSVRLHRASVRELPGDYDILPVPPALSAGGVEFWGHGKSIVDGRNRDVYSRDRFYPSEHVRIRGVGRLRTWKIAEVDVWPCRYNPITGQLAVLSDGVIVLDYSLQPTKPAPAPDAIAQDMARFVDNAEQARSFYPETSLERGEGYVIITRSAIVSSSSALAAFVAHKESRGYSVTIVTESEWGGGTGDTAAENIRAWLRGNYLALGLRYALLIGDPSPYYGSVPMKLLWPRRKESSFREAASDYYYADLTGNWDVDGDRYYGEEPDDFGPGGIDRIPELYVGRIPYYGDSGTLDSILRKIIVYETSVAGDWSRKFLLPMKPLDTQTPSYHLGEDISQDIALPLLMLPRRVYDSTYSLIPPPEIIPCDYTRVFGEWVTNGAGVVVWMTHGTPTLASGVFTSDRCASLDDRRPSIVFSASCDNGWPEHSENLGYALLRRGAVCTQSASRASFYYPGAGMKGTDSIGGMAYEFAKNLLQMEQECGRAAYESRLALPCTIWANHVVYNVYGDPSVRFNGSAFGGVTGRVFDELGQPLAGASVRTPDGRKGAVSSADGTYLLNGLGMTSLDIIASAPGHYSQRYYDFPVTAGALNALDVYLRQAVPGSLMGSVQDEQGTPITGAMISLSATDQVVSSDTNGSFVFGGLEPGSYSLIASKAPYAQRQVAECAVVEGEQSVVSVTLRLRDGNALTNGSFEAGFAGRLAIDWRSYSLPIGYGGALVGFDQMFDGNYSQKLALPIPASVNSRIGIFQTAEVLSGCVYRLSVRARSYISGTESDPAENVACRVGYDVGGGTDPTAPCIVWTEFTAAHGVWNGVNLPVKSERGAVTIFLEGLRKLPSGGVNCYVWFDAATLTGPAHAPPVPTVTVMDRWITPDQPIAVTWSECGRSAALTYEYAVASKPDGSGIISGGQWTSVGVGRSALITGLDIRNGARAYVVVRAVDNETGIRSEMGISEAVRVVEAQTSIGEAKRLADGTWVRIDNTRVSRMGENGGCFVQSADGAAGIAVRGQPRVVPVMAQGTQVVVVGRLASENGSRLITDAEVRASVVRGEIRPRGMSNSRVGGSDYFYVPGPPERGQKGSAWGRGVNNVGLLVAVWGRVRSVGPDCFTVDDGTLPEGLPVTCCGSARSPKDGSYVRVVGIACPHGVIVCDEKDISGLD